MALGIRVLVLAVFLSVLASFVPVGIADAQAQQPAAKVYRIGFLSQGSATQGLGRGASAGSGENEDTSRVGT